MAVAEMAFAGGLGATIDLHNIPNTVDAGQTAHAVLLFSESNTRFLCEVPESAAAAFERELANVPHAHIGSVTAGDALEIVAAARVLLSADLATLKAAWQAPLNRP